MKKLKLSLVALFAVLGATVMNSCGPDGDDPVPSPTLNFLGGSEYVSSNVELATSTSFKIGIEAKHELRLKKMEIRVSYNGGAPVTPPSCTTLCDSSLSDKELSVEYIGKTDNNPGTETYTVTIIDKDGNTTSKSVTITVKAPPKPIQKIDVTLGNQNSSSVGSTYSLSLFDVYLLAAAKASAKDMDMIYVNDDVEGEILCAPSSSVAADKLPGASGPASWSVRNATKLRRTSLTSTDFANMTDNAELLAELENNASASDEVKTVAVGDVILVDPVSVGGRYALVHITSIDVDNTMTMQIAVEK